MSEIIRRKSRNFKDIEYYQESTGRIFSRIIGGLAWPSHKPGAVVVMGEEMTLRPPAQIFVLTVFHRDDLGDLIQKTLEFRNNFRVAEIYANVGNETSMRFLQLKNRASIDQRTGEVLHVSQAPHVEGGSISYHMNLIKSVLTPEKKMLQLGNNTLLSGAIAELQTNDVVNLKDSENPLMAAFGFAVVPLVENPFLLRKDRPQHSITEYDVLNGVPAEKSRPQLTYRDLIKGPRKGGV